MNSKSSKRSGRRGMRRRGRKQAGGGQEKSGPPEFVPTMSLGKKFRFNAYAGNFSALPITRGMLLNLYTMATTVTVQNRIITAIKLNRVRMWGQPEGLASNNPVDVRIEWLGSNAPSTIHSDTAIGIRPAFVKSHPPVDSSDRWWSISGSNETEVLCKLSGPLGTIIDVDCTVRFADDEAAVLGETGTAAGSTAGQVYWNYLDGFASKQLIPMGGVTVLP